MRETFCNFSLHDHDTHWTYSDGIRTGEAPTAWEAILEIERLLGVEDRRAEGQRFQLGGW